MTETVKAVAEAVSDIASAASSFKTRQSETEIVKLNRKLKKATDIVELELMPLIKKYIDSFDEKDKKKIEKAYNKFKKYN